MSAPNPRSVLLPEELAPQKRAAALELLEQVQLAHPHPDSGGPRGMPGMCCECWRRGGKLVEHHRVRGDDTSLVHVHPRCRRRMQRAGRR